MAAAAFDPVEEGRHHGGTLRNFGESIDVRESKAFDAAGAPELESEPDVSFEAIIKAHLADEQVGAS
jgi:hypothetical protein